MSEEPTEKDEPGDGTECPDSETLDRLREEAKKEPPDATKEPVPPSAAT